MPTVLHPLPGLRMSGTVRLLPLYAVLVCMGTTLLLCVIINNTIEWGILHFYRCNIFVSHILLDCIHMIALYLLQAVKLGIIFVQLLFHSICSVVLFISFLLQIKGSFSSKRGQESFNPYSHGNVCSNCFYVLCGPVAPSLIGE